MSGASPHVHPSSGAARGASRWGLLGALILGMLALHFLSGHDSAGHHRVLTPPAAVTGAQLDAAPLATSGISVDAPAGDGPADGHPIVAGALLLLTVAVVGLAGALRGRRLERRPPAYRAAGAGGRRGPPSPLSRRALCVERI